MKKVSMNKIIGDWDIFIEFFAMPCTQVDQIIQILFLRREQVQTIAAIIINIHNWQNIAKQCIYKCMCNSTASWGAKRIF